jgi:cardiolipin synthase
MKDSSAASAYVTENPAINKSRIERILGIFFSANNKVRLLQSGRETFQAILDSVATAKRFICIEFYIFKDDTTGRELASLLKKKSSEGVKVYLLYDHFGSFLTSARFWSDLKKKGVTVRVSHPFRPSSLRSYLYRNHKKLLIIDGECAFTGGFNIADEYHGYFKKRKNVWRDTGIYLEGPIASVLLSIFNKSWKTWKGELIEFHGNHRNPEHGVPVIPVFANSNRARRRMRKLLLYSIRSAKKSIYLTTAYFIPSRKILGALINAAERGVTLQLLLPGKSDVVSACYAGRSYYRKLLISGAEIYEYQEAVLHAKTAVFDECWSIVGSANLDLQSLRRNEESNVGILDTDFSKKMIEIFQNDLQNSIKIETATWAKRPFYQKILEKFFSIIMKKL